MAKKPVKEGEAPGVGAVRKYAAALRDAAARARGKDPWVELYAPTDAAAKALYSQMKSKHGEKNAGQMAIAALAYRARKREMEIEEHEQRALTGRKRLVEVQSVAAGERAAVADSKTIGQRIDDALWSLGILSEAKVSRLDGDVVTGSKHGSSLPFTSDRHDRAQRDALALAERLERDAQLARRRMVEEAA